MKITFQLLTLTKNEIYTNILKHLLLNYELLSEIYVLVGWESFTRGFCSELLVLSTVYIKCIGSPSDLLNSSFGDSGWSYLNIFRTLYRQDYIITSKLPM